jgi:autotransporter-associated beta strand protein
MKQTHIRILFQSICLLALAGALATQAQTITRADLDGLLNTTGDWTGGVVPGSSNIAQWDSTVATPANTSAFLGASMSWAGINVVSPASGVVVNAQPFGAAVTMSGSTFSYSTPPDFPLYNGLKATLSGTATPEGFTNSTYTYYVVGASGNTSFQLSGTSGGAAIVPSIASVNIDSYTAGSTTNTTDPNTFAPGNEVVMGGTAPGGFTSGTIYFVVSRTATTVVLSATPGGTPIAATTTGTTGATLTGDLGTAVTVTGLSDGTIGLTLGTSGINVTGNQNLTLNCPLTIGGAQTWNVASPQTLTVGGAGSAIAITSLLTINGTGTVAFGATANTGAGGVTLNSGSVFLGAAASAGTGTLTLNGGTVEMVGLTVANPVNVTGTTTISNGLSACTFSGNFTGAGTLNVFAATNATVTFSAAAGLSAFTGTVKMSDMNTNVFLRLSGSCSGSTAATFDLGNGSSYIHTRNGQAVSLGALKGGIYSTIQGARTTTASGTTWMIGYNNTSTVFYGLTTNGTVTGNAWMALTKVGTGTLTLAGTNCYTGPTTVLAGTLALSNGASLSGGLGLPNYSTNIIVAGGATLDVSGLSSTFNLVSGQMLSNGAAATGIIKGNVNTTLGSIIALSFVTGTPSLTVASGTLTLDPATTVKVNNIGASLAGGRYKLISSTGGTVAASGAMPTVTVTGSYTAGALTTLYISGGELYLLVNAPVAKSFTLGATIGVPVSVPVNPKFATDPVGDALTLAIGTPAANGTAAVDGTGSNIIYTATSGTSDSFTYTATDPANSVVATGTVTVTISQTGQSYNSLTPPVPNGSGQVTMSFAGIPGDRYALDWTQSLTPPVVWAPLITNTAAANGILLYTNTPSVPGPDFYRTRFVSHP